jgi:hypothetical protein
MKRLPPSPPPGGQSKAAAKAAAALSRARAAGRRVLAKRKKIYVGVGSTAGALGLIAVLNSVMAARLSEGATYLPTPMGYDVLPELAALVSLIGASEIATDNQYLNAALHTGGLVVMASGMTARHLSGPIDLVEAAE